MTETVLITVGELLVEFVSHRQGCGLQRLAEYSGPYPSGAPAIVADQAARCGARSMLFGSVGRDAFGRALLERLTAHGVETGSIRQLPELTTGTAFVSYNADGSRNFIFHISGTAADAVEFDAAGLPDAELLLHVSGASLGNPKLRAAVLAAVDAVGARGGSICCDPNARPELLRDDAARRALERVVDAARILLPSTSDIEFLYPGAAEETVIENLLARRADIVALKRGEGGVIVYADGQRHEFPGHRVTEVDPTGAGDCFCGTFIACLAAGRPVDEAARLANAAGALAVTRRGPMEGNSDLAAVTRFLENSAAGTHA